MSEKEVFDIFIEPSTQDLVIVDGFLPSDIKDALSEIYVYFSDLFSKDEIKGNEMLATTAKIPAIDKRFPELLVVGVLSKKGLQLYLCKNSDQEKFWPQLNSRVDKLPSFSNN